MRVSRRSAVDPFIVMDVMEAARAAEAAGRHIIHMEVGQPGTGAPALACQRLAAEMAQGPLGYTVALGRPELAALVAGCGAQDIALISDEIYHGLQYEGRAVSALELTDDVYVINSFSKYFSMTGWRLGWMVVPPSHVRVIERLAQNMFICPSHASQIAALAALTPEGRAELDGHRAVYAENRRIVLEALGAAGLTQSAPADGAFYVYLDVSAYTQDSLALSSEILREAGVAVTPGLDFDKARGARFLRLSYARSTAEVAEGMVRLSAFFAARS
jgi:aspartate/methionine/tyrosine aminotransferase